MDRPTFLYFPFSRLEILPTNPNSQTTDPPLSYPSLIVVGWSILECNHESELLHLRGSNHVLIRLSFVFGFLSRDPLKEKSPRSLPSTRELFPLSYEFVLVLQIKVSSFLSSDKVFRLLPVVPVLQDAPNPLSQLQKSK